MKTDQNSFIPIFYLVTNQSGKKYKFILFLELACQKRGVIMDVLHFHRRLVPDRRATSLTFGFVSFSDFLRVWKISSLSFCRRGSLVLELLSSSFLYLFCSYIGSSFVSFGLGIFQFFGVCLLHLGFRPKVPLWITTKRFGH